MIFADRKKHNNIWRKIMPNEEIQLESIPHGKLGILTTYQKMVDNGLIL